MAKKLDDAVRAYLSELGRKGGQVKVSKGVASLSPAERVARAKKAAAARWGKKRPA